MTEQDKHFLRIMREHLLHYGQIPAEDVEKLMAMARRPTRKAMHDEIERLRAALEYIAEGGLAYPEKHARAAMEGE